MQKWGVATLFYKKIDNSPSGYLSSFYVKNEGTIININYSLKQKDIKDN